MKKILNTLFILVFALFLNGCSNNYKIKEINYSEFNNLIKNKETFILYIGSASCHNCESFSPKFEEVISEYKIKNVKYIDEDNLSKKEMEKFDKAISVSGTPSVIFITKGEEKSTFNRIVGNISKEKIIARLKSNNIIKE